MCSYFSIEPRVVSLGNAADASEREIARWELDLGFGFGCFVGGSGSEGRLLSLLPHEVVNFLARILFTSNDGGTLFHGNYLRTLSIDGRH